MKKSSSSGFTLIEVLIAAIILFSSIAVVADIFSAASLSSRKATNVTSLYQMAPIAIEQIKEKLRTSSTQDGIQLNGKVQLAEGVFYWSATRINSFRPPMQFDDTSPYPIKFHTYNVNVLAEQGSLRQSFNFEVFVW
ncbi:type IV pilus modification PilV family protein [Pseudoalteromonas sp. G4]|uniref:type IV pilus modification PilV family protein n=1 Tax=Pseudoalteromonas sp. G4 TaxID=2992761 RepID=UPI00237EE0CA|nr:prepilin-type N-terminal cleavage/methylation domain-containing protein [Pseudoalteromonas sp. G4]MDE3271231.1 prepilin-type N-terminal cleavage/methylation domain-containing protein [Pseudoalteromonas sp. G4]